MLVLHGTVLEEHNLANRPERAWEQEGAHQGNSGSLYNLFACSLTMPIFLVKRKTSKYIFKCLSSRSYTHPLCFLTTAPGRCRYAHATEELAEPGGRRPSQVDRTEGRFRAGSSPGDSCPALAQCAGTAEPSLPVTHFNKPSTVWVLGLRPWGPCPHAPYRPGGENIHTRVRTHAQAGEG